MIRREATSADGQPVWLLIPQTQHARLAGILAANWESLPGLSTTARDQLLTGIHSHDWGWDDWDDLPDLDPQLGRPYQFNEMPGTSMLPIWARSIHCCELRGPLAGYAASGHFCELLEHHLPKLVERTDIRSAKQFLEQESARRERYKWRWAQQGGIEELELSVRYLQSFDFLSLWLCCAVRKEPIELAIPMGDAQCYRICPRPSNPMQLSIDPWPLAASSLGVFVAAQQLPAVKYPNRGALLAALSEELSLSWRLVRLPPGMA